jgi:hypothetical protein
MTKLRGWYESHVTKEETEAQRNRVTCQNSPVNKWQLILNKKCLFFFKTREQEGKTVLVWGVGTSVWRGGHKKGFRRVNMVEYYALMYEMEK